MATVQVLTSEGCLPCLRVKRILKELQEEIPSLGVEEIDYASPRGMKLAFDNNVLYPPAVFLDGKLIAKGKIYAEKMIPTIREASMTGTIRESDGSRV
ncbi:MAG: hypothetical protein ACLPY5_06030 [Candidatus Bathyarchaeia archaeon]